MAHRHHVEPSELTPLAEYRRRILGAVAPLDPVATSLLESNGCVRAADVDAGVRLAVVGEVAAGSAQLPSPGAGEAVRIMTGAPIPAGVDAVVPVELVTEADDHVVLAERPDPGDNLRDAGESVRAGELVLAAGTPIGPAEIGMLAAMGIPRVDVHPKVRVATLATGDELVEPGRPLQPGQIHESNSYGLAAQVVEAGAIAYRQQIARDDADVLRRAITEALSVADVLVTSGGVSAGRYDLSKQVLAEMGDDDNPVTFTKVAMQPGMPQAFGTIDGIPVFGLPGNPVSSAVSFELHVRPAIRRMQGWAELNRPRISAELAEDVHSPPHKVSFLRVTLEPGEAGWRATTTGAQGSGILRSMVLADGLAEIPADRTEMAAGETVTVHLLGRA